MSENTPALIGQHKRDLSLVAYRPGWVELYEREAELLRETLGAEALRIEHIGSTSIPGMQAKAIIDIMVAVGSLQGATALIPCLEAAGYEYKPNDTVPERIFFAKESRPEHRTHHLNLTPLGSGFWVNQVTFRDYLRSHPDVATEYVDLKQRLVVYYARTQHLDREWKTEFVRRVLQLAQRDRA